MLRFRLNESFIDSVVDNAVQQLGKNESEQLTNKEIIEVMKTSIFEAMNAYHEALNDELERELRKALR